jgi:hypothetical protein
VLNTISNGTPAPLNSGNPYIGSKPRMVSAPWPAGHCCDAGGGGGQSDQGIWYQKWWVHLRHRPESVGAIVYLDGTTATITNL